MTHLIDILLGKPSNGTIALTPPPFIVPKNHFAFYGFKTLSVIRGAFLGKIIFFPLFKITKIWEITPENGGTA